MSLFPSDNPLIIREGTHLVIECVVNGNAAPTPTITWYLGSSDITNTAGNNTSFINITGRREDNMKTIQCRATNTKEPNNASTTLIVECKNRQIQIRYIETLHYLVILRPSQLQI